MRSLVPLVLILPMLAAAGCSSTESIVPDSATGAGKVTRSIPMEDLGDAVAYWNTDWKGQARQLYQEIQAINRQYFQTHRYVPWQTDCNDMAVDVWDRLNSRGIVSLIVVGNLELSHEAFADCNHAWLMVYSGEGSSAAVEPTRGEVFTWEHSRAYPGLEQYWEGFAYETPSELWADFVRRW